MASGHAPHKQAGHMTAPTNAAATSKKLLLIKRRPHMTLSVRSLVVIFAAQIDHCAPYRWAQIPVLMGLLCKLMLT